MHAPRPGGEVRTEDMGYAYWKRASPARAVPRRCRPAPLAAPSRRHRDRAAPRRAHRARRPALTPHRRAAQTARGTIERMTEKVIPLADHRYAARGPTVPADAAGADRPLADTLGRPLRDLRISVTDRCNFRCSYCMPQGGVRQGLRLPAARVAADASRKSRAWRGCSSRTACARSA